MIKTLRFFWRLLITFVARRKKIILLSFTLGIFSFFFLPKFLGLLPQRQETKSIGLVGRYTPENIPEEIQRLVSLGLTKQEADGNPSPGLAKEWTVEGESKIYTFKLADNLYWHDGKEVKAQDINYNFVDVQIKNLDPKVIQFILKEPFSPFPIVVSRPVFKKGLVGAGPYRVKKITKSGQLVETIFLESTDGQKPNLKYRFYPTESAAKTGLKLGEVKILENIVEPGGFETWPNIEIIPQTRPDRYLALFFDNQKPSLEEKNFRQALAYALPKEQGQKRALGSISPLSWAYSSEVKPYEYDLENAKKLLAKVVEKDKEIVVKLTTVPSLLFEAEKIKTSWEALGIKTEIGAMTTSWENFQVLLAIQEIPPDPDQYPLWHSTQESGNITNFKNPRIDQLLEEGRKTQDREKRKKIYFDFQRFLVEEVPAIFLSYPTLYQISRK